jgi:tetratricopeptide (TPR) repeat protein
MHSEATPEFMRFTAPDQAALEVAIEGAREKLAAAEASSHAAAIVEQAADLGSMLTTARREHEALQLLRKYEELAESLSGEEPVAWYWNALATVLQYSNNRKAAEPYFARAVSTAQAGSWARVEAMALHHWGRCLVEDGHLSEAESRIKQALAIRERLGERQESSRNALLKLAQLRAAGDA